jgi:hypothetical protein
VAILLFGLALAFKNLLPRYIAEGRLLLNIGAVRERERVMYRGIPWRVTSINMFCQFTNPKITGSLRVPIAELHDLVSRPTSAKDWFPSSEGDWILDHDENPLQVLTQGVEMVELQDLDRMTHRMATSDYYAAGFRNISAGKQFRVAVRFGIDYSHQVLNTEEVCASFKRGIEKNFEAAPFADDVEEVRVEFDEAAESSLNYVMFAFFKPTAARHHNRIKRRIQTACVAVCNANDWIIPFPQLTLHRPNDGQSGADLEANSKALNSKQESKASSKDG